MINKPDFNIIPCKDNSKLPAIPWKEFQTKKYTDKVTTTNYAIICGETSNVFVIDVDSPELIHFLFTDFEVVKDTTLTVQTGSGGYHIYFEYDPSIKTMRLDNEAKNQHIDIQSQGTYVIGPDSIHPDTGKPYKIISRTQNIHKMNNFSGFIQQLKTLGFNTEGSGLLPFQEIAKGNITVGNRNASAFKYACNLLDNVRLDQESTWFELKRWNSSIPVPLTERELRTLFESAVKKTAKNIQEEHKPEKLLREIVAADEGKDITFNAFISGIDEHKTVTTEMTCSCNNGHDNVTLQVKGNGYENPSVPRCPTCKYYMTTNSKKTNDVRMVVLQELPDEVKDNNIFRKEAKLIGKHALDAYISTKRIQFTGKLKSVPRAGKKENDIILHIKDVEMLDTLKDEVSSHEELEEIKQYPNILEHLAKSFAPDIYGYTQIKKILLLHLVGGGNLRRKQIHILLIGNPSKAKSELLKATNQLAPSSSYINGKMASGAGLAYGMVKLPNGTSVAQVGALGLSKFVQIDELDKMKIEDRGALLEVMEQQSISLTKSGINSSIPAVPSVVSAANPKFSTWDTKLEILKNINFESFLLTRFDLTIGLISDNPVEDEHVYQHIVNTAIQGKIQNVRKDVLIRYLNLCREKEPKLTKEAGNKISDFFREIKKDIVGRNEDYIPIETRQLEGLIRLATAHAKINLKDTVDIEDVDAVIELFKYSLDSLRISYEGGKYQLTLAERKMSQEQVLRHLINDLKDAQGNFDGTLLVQKLALDKRFGDINKAKKYFDRCYNADWVQLNPDGTYREPNPI